jgi:hypothetical protein
LNLHLLLLASALRVALKALFGAGLTVQRSNVNGDILDPVGKLHWISGCVATSIAIEFTVPAV